MQASNQNTTSHRLDGLDPHTKADHAIRQESKIKASDRRTRRDELIVEIRELSKQAESLRQLPPATESLANAWIGAIKAMQRKFVVDLQMAAKNGATPMFNPADKNAQAYLFGDHWIDRIPELAAQVSGEAGATQRIAKLGYINSRLIGLRQELSRIGG